MKNRGSTLILTNLVGVHPRNIHTKFEANPCSGLREVEKVHAADDDNGHSLIARVTLTIECDLKVSQSSLLSPTSHILNQCVIYGNRV